jgi:chromosomal replication initiator protein
MITAETVRQTITKEIILTKRCSNTSVYVATPYCKITDKNLTDDNKVDDIKEIVCKYFGISLWMIESRSRKREIVEPRQIAATLVREFTRFSLKGTGLRFGGLDHSSIISAVNTVNDLIATDKDYRKKFEYVKMLVQAKLGR